MKSLPPGATGFVDFKVLTALKLPKASVINLKWNSAAEKKPSASLCLTVW